MRFYFTLLYFFLYLFSANGQSFSICKSVCTGNLGENIFPNGDFGSGLANIVQDDPGIAPGYIYQRVPPPNDGFYTITNDISNWGSYALTDWIDIQDNGPEPNGYMMVVNAANTPGLFFERSVPVCENTLYEFSIDVISVNVVRIGYNPIAPDLTFLIDDKAVCGTSTVPVDQKWHTFRFSFTAQPGKTEVKLSLRNNAPGGLGNDLAIDNISFRACGPTIDLPVIGWHCAGLTLNMEAKLTDSPFNTPAYQWQSSADGGKTWMDIAGATATRHQVSQPDTTRRYRVVVANTPVNLSIPSCRVASPPVRPQLDDLSKYAITGTDTIVCNGAPAVLEAGKHAAYRWSNGATTDKISAGQPGTYTVTITTIHGCRAVDSLAVFLVNLAAEATFAPPVCFGDRRGHIQAQNIRGGTGRIRFNLNDDPPQSTPRFDSLRAGKYVLRVRDSLGCTVNIPLTLSDPPPYTLDLGKNQDIFYLGDTIRLDVMPNYPPVSYQWQPRAGLSCSNCPAPLAFPERTTTFTLQVRDALGCTATDSLRIAVLPRVEVYSPNIFIQQFDGFDNGTFTIFPSRSATLVRYFRIYDRWGNLHFERTNLPTNDPELRWTGQSANGTYLPEAVYVWTAAIEFSDGRVTLFSGDVTMLVP
jgi:hypothetical protein